MPQFLRRAFESIKTMWGNLKGPQKVAIVVLAGFLVLFLVLSMRVGPADGMKELAGLGVTPEVRAEVRRQLDGLGYTKYKIDEGGIIRVPKEDYDRLFLDMVGLGVFNDDQLFKWLEEVNLTSTTWDKKQRMNVTVQRRLEAMIRQLDGVHDARVQLAPAIDPRVVGGSSSPAKAAVKITLKPGKQELSQAQVNGIASMVAGAVGELQPWNVTIMDNRKLYRVPSSREEWRAAEHRLALQQETEKHLADKLKDLLSPYAMEFGHEIPVQVFVKLSTRYRSGEEFRVDPENVVKHQYEDRKRTVETQLEASSVGVQKNQQSLGAPETVQRQSESDKLQRAVNRMNEQRTTFREDPGAIESVSVMVAIPVTYEETIDEVKKKIDDARKQAIEDALTTGLSPFAQTLPGAATVSKVPVSVQVVPIQKPKGEGPPEPPFNLWDFIKQYWLTLGLVLAVLIAIVTIGVIGLRGVKRAKELPVEQILKLTDVGVEIPPELPAVVEVQKIRETIKATVQRSPRTVAGIVKKWVLEK